MPDYKLYFLDEKGRVYRRQDLECSDDKEAMLIAKALKFHHGMELWRSTRCLRKYELPPKD